MKTHDAIQVIEKYIKLASTLDEPESAMECVLFWNMTQENRPLYRAIAFKRWKDYIIKSTHQKAR